jgi:hypothetical protein
MSKEQGLILDHSIPGYLEMMGTHIRETYYG